MTNAANTREVTTFILQLGAMTPEEMENFLDNNPALKANRTGYAAGYDSTYDYAIMSVFLKDHKVYDYDGVESGAIIVNKSELSGDDAEKAMKLIDALEDLDDVQDVFTNASFVEAE